MLRSIVVNVTIGWTYIMIGAINVKGGVDVKISKKLCVIYYYGKCCDFFLIKNNILNINVDHNWTSCSELCFRSIFY